MEEMLIEKLLNEYDRCVVSALIHKEYKFDKLRQLVKSVSEETEFIKYSEEMSESEVLKNIQEFINQILDGKKVEEI